MPVQVIHRDRCRLCDSTNVSLVVKLQPIPLSENYSADSISGKNAPRFPVDLYMCNHCGHVQQLDVIDTASLWANYTYRTGEAKGMPEHFLQVASKILKSYAVPPGSLVVDIGSNDGTLLRPFKDRGYQVLGIDPATEIAKEATESGIPTIPRLLSLPLAEDIRRQHGAAPLVFMFNAFAHADDMSDVARSIRCLLAPDGLFFFEAQYLLDILDGLLIATIFHEHISHHSVTSLCSYFERHGLELIDVERVPIQHGSIVGTVQLKGAARPVNPSVTELLELERERDLTQPETLKAFANRVEQLRKDTHEMIAASKKSGCRIAGYGAARSGPTLISQLGLADLIDFIVDDHPQKVNRFSPGDGIPILPTAELTRTMPELTVILAWVHAEKIIESNQKYLDRGGRFVVLCPQTRVVGSGIKANVGE